MLFKQFDFILFFFIFITLMTVKPVSAQKTGQVKIDSLISALESQKEDTSRVNTLNTLAYEFRNNNSDTAIYFGNEAMKLAIKLNYKEGLANSYSYIGIVKKNLGKYTS